MLEIKTNQLATRKKVLIDNQEYTVRRLGNIEQLDMSQYMRRLEKLASIEQNNEGKLDAAQTKEFEELSQKAYDMFVKMFDDGGDQSKSRALVASLSPDELKLMLSQIFEEDVPESQGESEVS